MSINNKKIRNALQRTIEDIDSRAQIEDCVRELITDVELSVQLHESVLSRCELVALQRKVREYEDTIIEMHAVQVKQKEDNVRLANEMACELWNVSNEIGSLLQIKEKHSTLLMEYDELVAKLLQAEDEMISVKQQSTQSLSSQVQQQNQREISAPTSDTVNEKPSESTPLVPLNNTEIEDSVAIVTPSNENILTGPINSVVVETKEVEEVTVDLLPTKEDSEHESVVVMLDDDDDEGGNIILDQLDTEILLHIFLFLDPLDVLNTAQINTAMYNRIDSLFNVGGGDEDGDAEVAISSVPSEIRLENFDQDTTKTHERSMTDSGSIDNKNPISSHPTIVEIPSVKIAAESTLSKAAVTIPLEPRKGSSAIEPRLTGEAISLVNTTPTVAPISAPSTPGRGIFSILQPKAKTASPPRSRQGSVDIQPNAQQQAFQPLNEAMANSMAAKLSDAELNAIILMTERLKQKEFLASQYKEEKDALAVKLESTESVKQFLVGKVREMESSLNASFNNEIKVAQQVESDQEIIGFLDGRVQELEKKVAEIQKEKQLTSIELEAVRRQASEKSTVMGDILQYEREKFQENEREWKATKKVLIKEVKNLRLQIAALQAERDGYREEKDVLSRALTNNGVNLSTYGHHYNFPSIERTPSYI